MVWESDWREGTVRRAYLRGQKWKKEASGVGKDDPGEGEDGIVQPGTTKRQA